MKITNRNNSQKGGTNIGFVLMGIAITLVVMFAITHFKDRNNDITIHLPKIEVH